MDAQPTPAPNSISTHRTRRERVVLLSGLLALACMLCWWQWGALASTRHTYATALEQLQRMRADSQAIEKLRRVPQAAAGRMRPKDELLGQVERSLSGAGIDQTKWHDSIPQNPVRLPKRDYRRLTTRLYFEGITLRQLAAFSYDLQTQDPTLRVSAINLTNRRPETEDYDVDLAVSYLIYAPRTEHAARTLD